MAVTTPTDRRAGATLQIGWVLARSAVAANDTLPAATTSTYANKAAHAIQLSPRAQSIQFYFAGGADGQSASAYFYIMRVNGDKQLVGIATITAGTMVNTAGRFVVDTINVGSNDFWPTGIKLGDELGANRMSTLMFDTLGGDSVEVLFQGISSESFDVYYTVL